MNLIDRCLYFIYASSIVYSHRPSNSSSSHINNHNIISAVYTLYIIELTFPAAFAFDLIFTKVETIKFAIDVQKEHNILLCVNTRDLGRRCPRIRVSNFRNGHWTRFPTPRWRVYIYMRNEKQTPIRKKTRVGVLKHIRVMVIVIFFPLLTQIKNNRWP